MIAAFVWLACGPKQPPRVDESTSSGDDGGTGFVSTEAGRAECQLLEDGGSCGCVELSFLSDVPALYFVLDRSGSMLEANKWQTVRGVIAQTLMKLGPRVRYAASVFPRAGTQCSAGVEVLNLVDGDSPAGREGPALRAFIRSTSLSANGGTPTAATLRSLTAAITGISGRRYVILATDGGPNCNEQATCDETQCIANIESYDSRCSPNKQPNCCTDESGFYGRGNCLDADATESAVANLKAAGVSTYVIGVPGSAPYAALLDRVATQGGTARATPPLYYAVDSSDASAFEAALRDIAAKVTASCDLPIDPPPADPSKVNVFFDDTVVPADPDNGWKLEGTTVKLVGEACNKVLAGDVLNLRVIGGCPTVKPR